MSWDIQLSKSDSPLGSKTEVREAFLAACERILDSPISRQGPTEVDIDDSFQYQLLFIGNKRFTESLCLSIAVRHGDPHNDPTHPARAFIQRVVELTGWEAYDTHNGKTIT